MKKTKILYLILIASILFIITSCGEEKITGESFGPEFDKYEFILDPDEWFELAMDKFTLCHSPTGIMLSVDFFSKSTEFSDLNEFIDFYKDFDDSTKKLYGSELDSKVSDLTSVDEDIIKKSDVISGKRQKIQMQIPDENGENAAGMIIEYIYLECENHFFAINYYASDEKFENGKKAADEAVSRLRIKN